MQKSQETNIKCVSLFTLDQVNDFISGYYKSTKKYDYLNNYESNIGKKPSTI